jgi:F0F1-type ATP synthase assembly protein I
MRKCKESTPEMKLTVCLVAIIIGVRRADLCDLSAMAGPFGMMLFLIAGNRIIENA